MDYKEPERKDPPTSQADKKSKPSKSSSDSLEKQNPELLLKILDLFSLKLETLQTYLQSLGQPSKTFNQTIDQGYPSVFCTICNKPCLVADTKQKSQKIKQRLFKHINTKSHKVSSAKYFEKQSNKNLLVEKIKKAANDQGITFLTSKEKEIIRKRKLENLLKDIHFLQVTESANHHLIQFKLHNEALKPGSSTRGSYTHGDDPALAVSCLSDLIKEKVKKIIAGADSVGIQMDESTDITKK